MLFTHSWQTDKHAGNVGVCKNWEAYFINHAHRTKKTGIQHQKAAVNASDTHI